MAQKGMDTDIIRGVGRDLHSEASSISDVVDRIGRTLQTAHDHWQGQDCDQFQNLWNSQYLGQLRKIISDIQDLSTAATRNAQKQDETSSAY